MTDAIMHVIMNSVPQSTPYSFHTYIALLIKRKADNNMSFIYAEKSQEIINGQTINHTNIFSDTKTTLIGAYKRNWSPEARTMINKYGFSKIINIAPKIAVAFAGNNTGNAHALLEWYYSQSIITVDDIIDKAYEIHMSVDKDDIEFIICYADDNNETHIASVKEQIIQRECSSAWIGSYAAFRKLQELRSSHTTSFELFRTVVDECKDDSVGGLIICDKYYEYSQQFEFQERLEAIAYRKQSVRLGQAVQFSRPSETGDCTMHYIGDPNDVIISFFQNNTTLVYSNRYRYTEKDANDPYTNKFLLPMIFDSSTGKPLEVICSE